MATKFRFIYNGVSSDFDDYYVRTDLFNQEQIWSFGSNNLGKLGDNTIVSKSSPIQEITFGVNWKQFSVNSFSSGIKTDGTLWTWGPNTFGQLGDNSIIHRSSAVQTVALGSNWYSIANGYQHTLAVKSDSTLWSWGRNSYGQLGSNVITHRSSPTQTIALGQNWTYVAGGYQHSLASKSDGTIWSFGRNNFGQLGTGLLLHRSSPTQTLGYANNWSSVACATNHIAAIKTDGTLWACGLGTSGQLGDGTSVSKSSPVQTAIYATNWSKTKCGYLTTSSIKSDGTLWLWGNNESGQLGDNTITHRSSPVQTVAFGTNWSSIANGKIHTAAIKTDGTLWTWGYNGIGALGDNTITDKSSPVQVIGFATNWSSVACGTFFTAAVKADGTLWTWGQNNSGQLGHNTTTNKSSPVQVVGFENTWSSVACGDNHTAAIKKDGTLWMWGSNANGGLGNNTITSTSSPVQTVVFGINWSSVACGTFFTAAIKTDGTIWTWGLNSYGRLGDNTIIHRSSPVQVIGFSNNWSSVACGYRFTAATKTDGTLWCWGNGTGGNLGDGVLGSRSSPVQTVAFGTTWSSVACGKGHMAAIKTDGTFWIWGQGLRGAIGDNSVTTYSAPIQPIGYQFATNWSNVKAGIGGSSNYTAAIKKDGTLWSWGSGTSGQLGNNNGALSYSIPVQEMTYSTIWSSFSAGNSFTAAIKTDGTLWTWGSNVAGQIGDNTTVHRSSPIQTVAFGSTWSSVSCGSGHVASVKIDGTLWLWGNNIYGRLGDNTVTSKSSPIQTIAFGTTWSKVSTGNYTTGAIKTDGTLWTWGYNIYGSLGDGTIVSKSSPVQVVVYAENWSSATGGRIFTAGIKTDGTLWTWGSGTSGQVGDNTIVGRSSPVQTVAFGTTWSSVSGGYYHTAGIKTDGTLWMWGLNTSGQLGDSTTIHRSSPVQTVAFGTSWSKVKCGYQHTAAIKTDGTLWTWGRNSYGRLGDNTIIHRSSPVQTIAGGINWSSVYGGQHHIAAIKTDGTLWTWGRNSHGQLGNSTITNISSPVQVVGFATNWSSVSCAQFYTAAIKKDGTLWMWGYNVFGFLGDGTTVKKSSPVQTTAFGTNWNFISCGYYNTAAIKTDGTLWNWGYNGDGNLGINATGDRSYPIQPLAYSFATNWSNITCGYGITAAIKTDGTLWTWGGINTRGTLGINSINTTSVPIQTIAYGTNWSSVACGYASTAAIKTDGTLWGWGNNAYGKLMVDLAAADLSSPVQILPGTTWLQFSAGKFHSAFVKSDKTLWSSGNNTYGQLGINTSGAGPYVYPLQEISASTSWKQTACGDNHTMTVKTDGTLWGWGYNAYGQIGDNTAITKSSPVQTFGSANTWKQVACGSNHTVAAKIDGTVWTWGKGTQGQLGTNTITHRSSPIQTVAYGSNWWKVAAGYNNTTALFNYNVTL